MTAACSAREETSYVSNEMAMLRAACSAVAHSPFAGGFVQLSDLGATCRIWSGVRVVDDLRGAGVADVRVVRVRVIKVIRLVYILNTSSDSVVTVDGERNERVRGMKPFYDQLDLNLWQQIT